jgi:hypothetical protein
VNFNVNLSILLSKYTVHPLMKIKNILIVNFNVIIFRFPEGKIAYIAIQGT